MFVVKNHTGSVDSYVTSEINQMRANANSATPTNSLMRRERVDSATVYSMVVVLKEISIIFIPNYPRSLQGVTSPFSLDDEKILLISLAPS